MAKKYQNLTIYPIYYTERAARGRSSLSGVPAPADRGGETSGARAGAPDTGGGRENVAETSRRLAEGERGQETADEGRPHRPRPAGPGQMYVLILS